jgi:hypothetical protein
MQLYEKLKLKSRHLSEEDGKEKGFAVTQDARLLGMYRIITALFRNFADVRKPFCLIHLFSLPILEVELGTVH